MYHVMLRKRPLGSRSYLGCPLRYLKTVLILSWIYCILDKADGLHHHGWIHIPRLAVPQAETYVYTSVLRRDVLWYGVVRPSGC